MIMIDMTIMIILIIMTPTRTEVFNVTSGSWRQLATLNVGRGMHACALYNGILVIVVIVIMWMLCSSYLCDDVLYTTDPHACLCFV